MPVNVHVGRCTRGSYKRVTAPKHPEPVLLTSGAPAPKAQPARGSQGSGELRMCFPAQSH